MMIRDFKDFKEYVARHRHVRRCIVRADLNLPSDVEDLTKVHAIKDTVMDVLAMDLRVVLISHYKRPSAEDANDPKYSLRNVVNNVSSVVGEEVNFMGGLLFDIDPSSITAKVTMLENLRFYDGETKNDRWFAEELAKFGDIYINDAFSVSHRRHASVCAITEHLPSFAGHSMKREIDGISAVTDHIKRPFTAIIGGSKISSKMEVLKQLSQTADTLVITGAMANTFLASKDVDMKCSLVERDQLEIAAKILREAQANIMLPEDVVAAESINHAGSSYDVTQIPDGYSCFDIGPRAIAKITGIIEKSRTLLWNGAVGAFEFSNFCEGSATVAKVVSHATRHNAIVSVIGGGETVASIGIYKDDITFISTAGGAFLEFVAGYKLPGVEALRKDEASQATRKSGT
ncbi:MAG: phosphoglycerate kinase [Holosporales bacterium]|nr:phosphoglycerate kinase [Holosporales bacterium]